MFVEWDGKQYVCFDQKTGQIFSIGPSIEPGYQYIEVEEHEVEPIKSFKEKMTDYTVAYNRKLKKFVLKKFVENNSDTTFRKIKEVQDNSIYDVLLEVDKDSNMCYINTDIELLDTMQSTNVDINAEIMFSFTKFNDPHILYDTVYFRLDDTQKKPIKISGTYSIYTDSDIANCVYKEV